MERARLLSAIEARRSRREYRGKYIDNHQLNKLRQLIDEYTTNGGVRMEMAADSGVAFNGLTKSYGMLSGVNNFVGMIAKKDDWLASEKLGYYGQLLMLEAVSMGLGTCWVSLTLKRENLPFTLAPGEEVLSTITFGNVDEHDSLKERFVRGMLNIRNKTLEELFISDVEPPKWFINGVRAAQKAPSAMKKQPVCFRLKNGVVTACVPDIGDFMNAHDLGIFKLHFQIGAGGGRWEWGNHGVYTPKEDINN
ncbi:MAG: nitroreductase [Defluviitaleaceae bacterium]|nr:nitroreductase [Defluviitaleaceae bacterium]